MAGKKKITRELIEEATKDELLDIAGRLGIEDEVNYKDLKAEIYEKVLTAFLASQEQSEDQEPSPVALQGSVAERIRRQDYLDSRKDRQEEPEEAVQEQAPEPEFPAVKSLLYFYGPHGAVRQLKPYELEHIVGIINLKQAVLERLQDRARREGKVEYRCTVRTRGRFHKVILRIVRQ